MVRKHLTGNQHHIKDPLEGSRFSCYFKSQNLCVVQCTYVESAHTDVRVNALFFHLIIKDICTRRSRQESVEPFETTSSFSTFQRLATGEYFVLRSKMRRIKRGKVGE